MLASSPLRDGPRGDRPSRRRAPRAGVAMLLALACAARGQQPAPDEAPLPATEAMPAGDDGISWTGAAPPSPEQLAADPAAFEALLAENGLSLDLPARAVSARGGTLHDRTTLGYPIEYVLVTERGRTHEALFILRCQPSLLDACLRAAGLAAGKAMRFRPRVPPPTDDEMDAGASPWEPIAGSGPLVDISVSWTDDAGVPHRRTLESLLLDVRDGQPLAERDWIYVGSRFGPMRQGKQVVRTFLADLQGDLVALYLTGRGDCLLERNSIDGVDDTLYTINADGSPARGTPVTVTFTATGRSAEPAPPQPDVPVVAGALGKALDDALDEGVQHGFAGVALVERGDEIVLHKGYGLVASADVAGRADRADRAGRAAGGAVTTATAFPLGGAGELFLATAVLQLEQKGRLKRDDVVGNIAPGLEAGTDAGATIRQLLERARGRSAEDARLVAIIERASGERWPDYLQAHVLGPAGMEQSAAPGASAADADAAGASATAGDLYRWLCAVRAGSLVAEELAPELLGEASGEASAEPSGDSSGGSTGPWRAEGVDRVAGGALAGALAEVLRSDADPPMTIIVLGTGPAGVVSARALAAVVRAATPAAPAPAVEAPSAGRDPQDGR